MSREKRSRRPTSLDSPMMASIVLAVACSFSVVQLRGQDLRREQERDHPSHEGSYQGTSVAMACLTKASTCLCDFNSGEVSARSCSRPT